MIEWTSALEVGHAVIDEDHRETVDLLNAALAADDAAFPAHWAIFHQHIKDHFGRENALMDKHGFPASVPHQGEHTRVLGIMANMDGLVVEGDLAAVRDYMAKDVVDWFIGHRNTMDFVTAQFLRMAERRA
jgi:hemerythrin